MLRFLLRLAGLAVFTASFIALIADGVRTISSDRLVVTPLGATWFALSPSSLNAAQAGVRDTLGDLAWDPLLVTLLAAPTFVVGGLLGLLLMYLGRRGTRRPQA
ncbi:hypothetical protein [Methylobrevis pamukkalensis]|uniref:Uncharacterized protein n=1 Tax=Methylobrevis pamukkalensis TaxID=1439726 RepID=A0A1E3H4N9_9HYPH|nr:hypothetical protein [Methylobrevis pamukkalensis]ODN71307.1 hypothetical protein A6302_01343 [Methylobrevis pamukkalensis]